jgi:hypothetical protein
VELSGVDVQLRRERFDGRQGDRQL